MVITMIFCKFFSHSIEMLRKLHLRASIVTRGNAAVEFSILQDRIVLIPTLLTATAADGSGLGDSDHRVHLVALYGGGKLNRIKQVNRDVNLLSRPSHTASVLVQAVMKSFSASALTRMKHLGLIDPLSLHNQRVNKRTEFLEIQCTTMDIAGLF
jgi:hypothetical protein